MKVRNHKQSFLRLRQGIRQGVLLLTIGTLLTVGFNEFRSSGIPWNGRWPASSVSAYHLQDLEEISLEETYSLYQQSNAVFIDARDPVSFQEGHIDGALNVPPEEAENYREEVLAMVKAGFEVIVYCDGVDCPLSPELARAFQRLGIPSVKVLVDGWSRWFEAGYPIAEGGL